MLELFADPELPGGTGTQATQRRQKRLTEAQERLEFILWYTTDGPMVNFNNIDFWTGEGVKRSDEGFALELRDSDIWVASSRQVGHFLTAANMGYSPSFMERSFTACIVGHEKLGDQTGIRHNLFQCLHSSNIDVMLFEAAANADREGNYALRDCFIGAILPDLPESLNPSATNGFEDPRFNVRSGNSRQDLRLSIKGWIFGQKIRDNEITTLADAQSWIRREIQE